MLAVRTASEATHFLKQALCSSLLHSNTKQFIEALIELSLSISGFPNDQRLFNFCYWQNFTPFTAFILIFTNFIFCRSRRFFLYILFKTMWQFVGIQRWEHDGSVQSGYLLRADTAAGTVRPRPSPVSVAHHWTCPHYHHPSGWAVQSAWSGAR